MFFGLGDFFTCSELGNDTEGRGAVAVCSEGGCGSMCWPVDRPATHAAAGAAARGALIFLFLGVLSHAREWMAREGLGVGGLIRCARRPREWSFGAVPPQERWHEGGWFLFFLWRLLRCRRGILSHAQERRHPALRRGRRGGFWFRGIVSHALLRGESSPKRGRAGGIITGRSNPVCGKIAQDVVHQIRAAID